VKRTVYGLLTIALISYAAISMMMFASQRSLIYFPQPRAVTAAEATLTLPVESAEIVVTIRPLDSPKAILYFGGNAEDVSRNLDSFTALFPDHALYLMHYRGYGGSTGQPTEKDNVADGLALLAKVRALHPEVTIMGRSLGSGVAMQVASQAEATRLVLITPFDSIVELGARLYPWLPVRLLAQDRYESIRVAPQIRIPATIIMAEHDEVVPRASTEKLLNQFKTGVATLKIIAGAGHNDIGWDKSYLEALQEALR
jgi:uncharacterized protein